MTAVDDSPDLGRRRYQATASLALVAIVLVTCLGLDLLARNKSLEQSLMLLSREFASRNGTVFSNTGNFIDFEDRLFLDELPNKGFSKGGIYFFGTSNTKWAFNILDFPPEQRHWIGNFGIGASTHNTELRLIRYLIDQRGFLSAGDRDLIILGVSFHLGSIETPGSFIFSLLRRHGLYQTEPDGRIVPVPMSALERRLRIEKARSGGFVWDISRVAKSWVTALRGTSHPPVHDSAAYQKAWRSFMGSQWEKNIDVEVGRLGEIISLIRAHHAEVKVMLLPQGTWMNALPYGARYDAAVRALCQQTSTPLIDFSHALPDAAFVDSNHLTVAGQKAFQNLIMGEIGAHLQKLEAETSATSKR